MSRLIRISILAWTVAWLVVALVSGAAAQDADRPNIVLCMADDQGWGDVGYRDHPVLKTPVLDEMAATGLRMERFYAAAPVCSPTRGSVLTGRHPNRFGCFAWGHALRPQEVTIAEGLKSAGYTTGHFGKWHVGPVSAGSPASPGESGFDEWLSSPNFFENDPLLSHNGKVIQTKGESSRVTVDAALEFIRAATKNETPFLAVVWFGSPHGPHIASDEFRKLYPDQPKNLQNFYGEISGIDSAMGRMRSALRELNIADNTILWYTSDNGALPVGSTGGLRGRKGNLYEGGIRVPSIIEWPKRIKEPRTTNVQAGTVDIYPTLLDIVDVRVPNQPPLDGISLVPLIEGNMQRREKPLGFWVYPARGIPKRSAEILKAMLKESTGNNPKDQPKPNETKPQYSLTALPGHSAWLDGNDKLHRIPGKNGTIAYALYDLQRDPEEKNDLADQQPDRVAKMKDELEAWQKSVVKSLNGDDYEAR